MNRLSPLVARTYRSPGRARLAAIGPAPEAPQLPSGLAADLRLFALGWLCGFVFFSTLFA